VRQIDDRLIADASLAARRERCRGIGSVRWARFAEAF